MRVFQNLILVGTSHIAKESIEEVERIINKENPEVVALELDRTRYYALINKDEKKKAGLKELRAIGLKGFLFAKLGEYIEKKLGKTVGVSPGDEMLKAAEVASQNKLKIALIDQKIEVTLKNFSKEITWKEKIRFFSDIIKGFLLRKKIKFDLNKVPDKKIIEELLKATKERYPNFYKVLVEDRNKYMAKKLDKLMKNYSKIVAVVGAGHEEEIVEEIKSLSNSSTNKLD